MPRCVVIGESSIGMPRLSIIIVSYNSRGDLEGCLQSLTAGPPAVDHEILVVDNASTDGTPDYVRTRWPGIRLIDPNVVGPAYEQLQQVRGYYSFPKILDVDRYTIDGRETDAVVAVREMDLSGVEDNPQACRLLFLEIQSAAEVATVVRSINERVTEGLSAQLAGRRREPIDWNTPWWRQLANRDRHALVVNTAAPVAS